jgi:dimethylhistidine N-methyltransferase
MSKIYEKKDEHMDSLVSSNEFEIDVLAGLSKHQKGINPKYFYDEIGSILFEKITEVPEYYITRTELAILEENKKEMSKLIGKDATLIEFGSGSSTKVKILLDNIESLKHYIPIDISSEMLLKSADALSSEYKDLSILPICADFVKPISIPDYGGKRVIFYPGSTIGNFEPQKAKEILENASAMLQHGDGLLIGVDLKKDREVLEKAYNDASGVTEQFNLNMIKRINKELNANFKLSSFSHLAFYNDELGRIEMHLKSLEDQSVMIGVHEVHFSRGETIHTENSYKYSVEQFHALAKECGFTSKKVWTDSNKWFSVHYLEIN